MLFTRCPHCNTTFRITAEALTKANGQVRCGRCVNVFNAHADLREQSDEDGPDLNPGALAAPAQGGPEPAQQAPIDSPGASDARAASSPSLADAAPIDIGKPIDVDADQALAAPADAPASEEIVLSSASATSKAGELATTWSPDQEEEAPPERASLWRVAAIAGLCLLLLQITHHFRAEFAGQPIVGPIVQSTYAFFGSPVTPRWNVEQYQVVDWIATAEPAANGRDTLAITARIQNRGPDAQPYPHIHVQLKDRWESAIGSRVFKPEEYVADGDNKALMAAGDTVQARLIVVDPGPDAYGFEIDVCVQHDADRLRCASDQVFQ
jgi:predicted Zn finger-like uncharacterized protein